VGVVPADVAYELYGRLPEEFTEARNARAKELAADGDRELASEVRRLPKPTMAAWLANTLVRTHAAEVEELIALGPALRDALGARARLDMRRVADRRRAVIKELVDAASQSASQVGHPMAPPVQRQLEETLEAAMVDDQSAGILRSGMLSGPLVFVGFGGDDASTSRVLAQPPGGKPKRRAARVEHPDERRHAAEQAVTDAAGALSSARRALQTARELVEEVRGRRNEASARQRSATKELHAANRDVTKTDRELSAALRAREGAERKLKEAGREHAKREARLSSTSHDSRSRS
jgi:hypothetical protein